MNVPLPAIVFISALLGCMIILCIIYQLIKRDKCCQVHGREDTGEDPTTPDIRTPTKLNTNETGEHGPSDDALNLNNTETNANLASPAIDTADGANRTVDTTIDLSISDTSFPSINLLPVEDELVSTCGRLLLETTFSPVAKKMTISVVRAADIPGPDRGGTPTVQVHLTVLPNRKFKFRTKPKPAESPVFNEKFHIYPVSVEALEEMSMRVRLYGKSRFSKKVLGELEILFTEVDLHSDLSDEPMWKTLLPYGMAARLATLRELHMEEEEEEQMK